VTRALTALALLAVLALPGCGGDKKTIPRSDASSLIADLRDARDAAGDPDKCPELRAAVRRVQSGVGSLPASVDNDTRDSLVNGVNNLIDEASRECENAQTTPTTTTPTTTTPTATTETTPPPPTETTPPTTTPTAPTAPTQTTPTAPGNGNGNGNGGTPPGQNPGTTPGQDKKKKPKGGKKGEK
jgi:hypothetical protein